MNTFDNDAPGKRTAPDTLVLERLLPGPIERVWAYLSDPEKRRTWFGGGDFDLRAGGKGEVKLRHSELTDEQPPEKYRQVHDEGISFPVTIVECAPPHRLTLTWPGESGHESHVSFALAEEGDKVRFTITHSRLASTAEMVDVAGGWHSHTALLLARLEGRQSPPFWSKLATIEDGYRAGLSD